MMKIEDLADGLHIKWTITCPHCLVEFSGVIHRGVQGTLRFDPACPKCKRISIKLTNIEWPPLPEGTASPVLTLNEIVGLQ